MYFVTVVGLILISIAYNERSHVVMDSLEVSEELALLREFIIHHSHGSKSQIEHSHFGMSLTVRVDDLSSSHYKWSEL